MTCWLHRLFVAVPVLWVAAAHVGPLLAVARISLLDAYPAAPGAAVVLDGHAYAAFLGGPGYRAALGHSLWVAAAATGIALVLTWPLAWHVAVEVPPAQRARRLALLIAPFWTSEVLRMFALVLLLANRGALNAVLRWAGLADAPVPLLYGTGAVLAGIIYTVLLTMLLSVYAALDRLPRDLLDAAADLGAGPWRRQGLIVLPLAAGGIASGVALTFLLCLGVLAAPALLGGAGTPAFAAVIAGFFGGASGRWPMGGGVQPRAARGGNGLRRRPRLGRQGAEHARRVGKASRVSLGRLVATCYWIAVLALMLPLGLIVLTGLTDATLVGFPLGRPSLRWHAAALADPANARALLLSLALAAASAALAVAAGTWIALAAGFLRPGWRWLLLAGALVPLATPGIVHAIALRIAIRAVGLDPGPFAVLLGHVVHATPLAALMAGARLATLPPELVEAAQDLGAGPVGAFWLVKLPWLGRTLIGAALLAALNSFDDFVRSFFLGGYEPTLPVLIFGRLRSGLTPEINALATLALLEAGAIGAALAWLARARPAA